MTGAQAIIVTQLLIKSLGIRQNNAIKGYVITYMIERRIDFLPIIINIPERMSNNMKNL